MNPLFVHSDLVAGALRSGAPVVALETTVVTHGLPHPDGVEAAAALEDDVRAEGATPATIAILDGAVRIGVSRDELHRLAASPNVTKTNLSNLAAVVASGEPGSTTVAATMFAARGAGIRVFATGGIGGVHRDADRTGDISADLTALSRLEVAVVCAGAKAILDLPRTVEMLETLGVPILGLQTSEFPAFYRRTSGLRVDRRVDSIAELADAVRAHFALALGTGVLVANPIPADAELAPDLYDRGLGAALSAADERGLRGRDVTPFLLDFMRAVTGGDSVRANLALLRNNARVAARLAVALAAGSPA